MKRCALYLRVSTVDQSTEMQRRELEAYVAARGWQIVEVFEDRATGTSTAKRPQWHRLMALARARKVDVVAVWRLDRWARSLRDLVNSLQELTDVGVAFSSLNDSIDLGSSTGRLLTHLVAAFAAFEAEVIRERVRAGIANAKAKGTRLGRPPRIDQRAVVRLRREGLSLSAIAARVGATKGGVSKLLRKAGCK